MTVKELIAKLSSFPDDHEVLVYWQFENVHESPTVLRERFWDKKEYRDRRRPVVVMYADEEDAKEDESRRQCFAKEDEGNHA